MYENNAYWKDNESFHEEDAAFKADCARKTFELADISLNGKRIADIGCGSGRFLLELGAGITAEFTGVDVSPAAIERAERLHRCDRIGFRVSDIASLPDDAYDIITCNDVLEHVEDYLGFLREVRRVAPVCYFNIPLDMSVLSVLFHSYMTARRSVGHLHYFSRRSAIATLQHCGFAIRATRLNSSLAHNLKSHRTLRNSVAFLPRRLLYALDQDLGVHLLGGASLGVVCER